MKNPRHLLWLIFSIIALPGCTSIYLYETEKYSMTIEGRPDASSPVSFNFGVKERVATVIPAKTSDKGEDNCTREIKTDPNILQKHGEAMSLISYFNLNKTDKKGMFNDPVTVETAILTGKVASCLDYIDVPDILNAMVPGNVQDPGISYSIMRNIVAAFNKDQQFQQLKALDELAIAAIPKTYPVSTFVGKGTELQKSKPKGSVTGVIDITTALDYWGDIDNSAKQLKHGLSNPNNFKFSGVPLTDEVGLANVMREYEQSNRELERISKELAGNPAYINAIQFYIDNYPKQTKSGN